MHRGRRLGTLRLPRPRWQPRQGTNQPWGSRFRMGPRPRQASELHSRRLRFPLTFRHRRLVVGWGRWRVALLVESVLEATQLCISNSSSGRSREQRRGCQEAAAAAAAVFRSKRGLQRSRGSLLWHREGLTPAAPSLDRSSSSSSSTGRSSRGCRGFRGEGTPLASFRRALKASCITSSNSSCKTNNSSSSSECNNPLLLLAKQCQAGRCRVERCRGQCRQRGQRRGWH